MERDRKVVNFDVAAACFRYHIMAVIDGRKAPSSAGVTNKRGRQDCLQARPMAKH
jgi:hypothetical protein